MLHRQQRRVINTAVWYVCLPTCLLIAFSYVTAPLHQLLQVWMDQVAKLETCRLGHWQCFKPASANMSVTRHNDLTASRTNTLCATRLMRMADQYKMLAQRSHAALMQLQATNPTCRLHECYDQQFLEVLPRAQMLADHCLVPLLLCLLVLYLLLLLHCSVWLSVSHTCTEPTD